MNNSTIKKKTVKKKAPTRAQTKSLIKYADPCLKPKDGYIQHPLYLNKSNKLEVLPRCMFEIRTGLEIAVPQTMALITHLNLISAVQIGGIHFGHQKELILRAYNVTSRSIEVDPYQVIGSVFLSEIKPWK